MGGDKHRLKVNTSDSSSSNFFFSSKEPKREREREAESINISRRVCSIDSRLAIGTGGALHG